MSNRLIIGGRDIEVPDVHVLRPGEADWLAIQSRDGRPRTAAEQLGVQMVVAHTTAGKHPHRVVEGVTTLADAISRMRAVANYWRISERGSQQSGAAHMIIHDRFVAQLVDLLAFLTHHAGNNSINLRSVGIEMVQENDGSILSSTFDTCVRVCRVLADVLGIPFITTSVMHDGHRVHDRLRRGGRGVAGFYGHRDNSWYEYAWFPARYSGWRLEQARKTYPDGYADRGPGDPTDEWYTRMRRAGALAFNLDHDEDTDFVKRVQRALNAKHGEHLDDDGVWGQKTTAAMRRHGLWNGGIVGPEFPVP